MGNSNFGFVRGVESPLTGLLHGADRIAEHLDAQKRAEITTAYKFFLDADDEQKKVFQESPEWDKLVDQGKSFGIPAVPDPNRPGKFTWPEGSAAIEQKNRKAWGLTPDLDPEVLSKVDENDKLAKARAAETNHLESIGEGSTIAQRAKQWKQEDEERMGTHIFPDVPFSTPEVMKAYGDWAKKQSARVSTPGFSLDKSLRTMGVDPRAVYQKVQKGVISNDDVVSMATGKNPDLAYKLMDKNFPGRYTKDNQGNIVDKATKKPVFNKAQAFGRAGIEGKAVLDSYIKTGKPDHEASVALLAKVTAGLAIMPMSTEAQNLMAKGKGLSEDQALSGQGGYELAESARRSKMENEALMLQLKGNPDMTKAYTDILFKITSLGEDAAKAGLERTKAINEGTMSSGDLIGWAQGLAQDATRMEGDLFALTKIPFSVRGHTNKALTPVIGGMISGMGKVPEDKREEHSHALTSLINNVTDPATRHRLAQEAYSQTKTLRIPSVIVSAEIFHSDAVKELLNNQVWEKVVPREQGAFGVIPVSAFKGLEGKVTPEKLIETMEDLYRKKHSNHPGYVPPVAPPTPVVGPRDPQGLITRPTYEGVQGMDLVRQKVLQEMNK